ncbi:hypothetical protein L195_g005535 [Trifolium pratense]|uniref:Uncharacterized protein n=1 Tax=Trifolium pratense TaxID=57577 RepID=A0A2K3P175_TRIPR|nr:hypothetical protein L195_g005535 [Trifolium pratense]
MNGCGSDESLPSGVGVGWVIGLALPVREFVRSRVRNSSIGRMAMVHEEIEDSRRFESHR